MGEFQHSIDEKGRIIVPAKFRESLGTTFIVTRGLDQCLFVYPMEEWVVLEQKLKSLSLMKSDARAFSRFFSPVPENVNWISRAELICQITLLNMPNWIKIASLSVFPIVLRFGASQYG